MIVTEECTTQRILSNKFHHIDYVEAPAEPAPHANFYEQ